MAFASFAAYLSNAMFWQIPLTWQSNRYVKTALSNMCTLQNLVYQWHSRQRAFCPMRNDAHSRIIAACVRGIYWIQRDQLILPKCCVSEEHSLLLRRMSEKPVCQLDISWIYPVWMLYSYWMHSGFSRTRLHLNAVHGTIVYGIFAREYKMQLIFGLSRWSEGPKVVTGG
jgi:hypothetical protein